MKIHTSFGEIFLKIYTQSEIFSLKRRPKLEAHSRGLYNGGAPPGAHVKLVTTNRKTNNFKIKCGLESSEY